MSTKPKGNEQPLVKHVPLEQALKLLGSVHTHNGKPVERTAAVLYHPQDKNQVTSILVSEVAAI